MSKLVFAKPSKVSKVRKILPFLTVVSIYLTLPAIGLRGFWIDVLTRVNIFLLITLSLDLYSGTTFYLNLGVPFTVGVSAYTLALLNRYLGVPVEYSILPSAITSTIFSFTIFIPSLRVRGAYFSILSLLLPIILAGLVTSQPFSLYLGGEGGISYFPLFFSYARALPAGERVFFLQASHFYLSAAVAIVAYIICYKIAYSDFGFMMRSIGQDELLAEATGINTFRVKLIGFIASSFLSALAGALYAAMRPPITADIFVPANTLVPPLTAVILGGMGTIVGPAIANYLTLIIYEILWGVLGSWRIILYMCLLIVLVLLRPQGLIYYLYLKMKQVFSVRIFKHLGGV
ncbi:MAG: branched-chain amino acid ABC transporter permease [Sulfolobales archaeon]|nr:branched-chain amino acid ABC transporter permease [Sulfolobales archaeon]MDW8083450.1 branched-chain amino acid ABC transporter permease [Sulfolobales archaeon]